MSAIDIVRKRILDQYEEEALDLLGGVRFGIEIDGELHDPWQLTDEERLQWMQQVYDAMHEIREEGRIVDFTKAWAGLDQEHRDHLLDENSRLFARSRLGYMKSLTDADCEWIVGAERWEVADLLTDDGPIYGRRPSVSFGNNGPVAGAATAPSFAKAA